MSGALMDITTAAPRLSRDARVARSLRWFALTAAVSTGSGVLLFCYRRQLGAAHSVLTLLHDVSSDAAVLLLTIYLWDHLRRTWRLRRTRTVSWWSGLAATAAWAIAGVTGVYGQWTTLRDLPWAWWTHVVGSFVAVVIVCSHAVHGFRKQYSEWKDTR